MLKNHFVKIRAGYGKTLPSNLHSVVYAALPNDRMCIKDDFINYIIADKECKQIFKDKKGVNGILEDLVKLGFVREIHSIKLEKLLD